NEGGEHTALLLDATGLVMAGTYVTQDGRDVAQEVGAELSGVSDEARRAMRHLELGDWSSLTVETDAAVVAMAPMRDDALLLVAASKAMPLGLVHRVLDRCVERANGWLTKGGG
ncbi:MAG TPA: roadblock/LC7 domain-containing protein, partial [Gemmatimonadaceae bacterium]|nr:roadblock/LC7 domain-containing protein [Gemmatimonadaceae bacterium]